MEGAVVLLLGWLTLLRWLAFLTLFLFLAPADDFGLSHGARLALDSFCDRSNLLDDGARRGENGDRGFRIVEDFHPRRDGKVAHVHRVANHHVGDVQLNAVGNARRIHLDLELAEGMIENSTLEPNPFGYSDEHDRNVDRDFLARHQRLKIDVQNLALDRVALDLANERLGRMSTDRHLDHRALRLNVAEHFVEIACVERERLWIAPVTVNHGGNLPLTAESPRGALSRDVATVGAKRNCCH